MSESESDSMSSASGSYQCHWCGENLNLENDEREEGTFCANEFSVHRCENPPVVCKTDGCGSCEHCQEAFCRYCSGCPKLSCSFICECMSSPKLCSECRCEEMTRAAVLASGVCFVRLGVVKDIRQVLAKLVYESRLSKEWLCQRPEKKHHQERPYLPYARAQEKRRKL